MVRRGAMVGGAMVGGGAGGGQAWAGRELPLMRLAAVALQDGRCAEAAEFARLRIQAVRNDGDAWHLLGAALLTEGEWTAAHEEWRRGVEAAPMHPGLRDQAEKDRLYAAHECCSGGGVLPSKVPLVRRRWAARRVGCRRRMGWRQQVARQVEQRTHVRWRRRECCSPLAPTPSVVSRGCCCRGNSSPPRSARRSLPPPSSMQLGAVGGRHRDTMPSQLQTCQSTASRAPRQHADLAYAPAVSCPAPLVLAIRPWNPAGADP